MDPVPFLNNVWNPEHRVDTVRRMSLRARPARLLTCVAATLSLAGAFAAPSGAAQRLESFALPSTLGNIDESTVELNKIDSLRATVLLPDGYDEQPDKAWPVLYLLQGIGDNSEAWAHTGTGNVAKLAKDFPGIIVMPEAGRGFFVDWFKDGKRDGPRWTRYYLDEVFPTIEQRYRVRPERQYHAIGGLSMGAYGAVFLGGQLPGYFGTVLSMSGLLDIQSPETLILANEIHAPYDTVWGGVTSQYATAHNPMRTIDNLVGSRLYLSTGNGIPDASFPFSAPAWTNGAAIESRALTQNLQYQALALTKGLKPTLKLRMGVHDWPYWRRELPLAIKWGLFGAPPVAGSDSARRWTFKTIEPAGNAWGIGYRFAAPAKWAMTLSRDGQTLRGTGNSGQTVTISPRTADLDATGTGGDPACRFDAVLPFERTLPAGC